MSCIAVRRKDARDASRGPFVVETRLGVSETSETRVSTILYLAHGRIEAPGLLGALGWGRPLARPPCGAPPLRRYVPYPKLLGTCPSYLRARAHRSQTMGEYVWDENPPRGGWPWQCGVLEEPSWRSTGTSKMFTGTCGECGHHFDKGTTAARISAHYGTPVASRPPR